MVASMAVATGCKKQAKKDSPGGDSSPPPVQSGDGWGGGKGTAASVPPAGWCEARDPVGGYRVYIPGGAPQPSVFKNVKDEGLNPTGRYAGLPSSTVNAKITTFSIFPPPGVKLGNTEEELFAELKAYNSTMETFWVILEKSSLTLGGKPAIKVVLKKKPWEPLKTTPDDDPEFVKAQNERDKKDQAMRRVLYLTNTATRMILITVETPDEPDPAMLKILTDSFAFL
jgi:hypothetical protein